MLSGEMMAFCMALLLLLWLLFSSCDANGSVPLLLVFVVSKLGITRSGICFDLMVLLLVL